MTLSGGEEVMLPRVVNSEGDFEITFYSYLYTSQNV